MKAEWCRRDGLPSCLVLSVNGLTHLVPIGSEKPGGVILELLLALVDSDPGEALAVCGALAGMIERILANLPAEAQNEIRRKMQQV